MAQRRGFRERSGNNRRGRKRIPLVRICLYVVGAVLFIGMCILIPVGLISKQAYITQLSLERELCRDSISALNRELALLNMRIESAGQRNRIESIARQRLGLDYPVSTEIVVVRMDKEQPAPVVQDVSLWGIIKRSLSSGNQ